MWQESWGKVELLLVMRIDEPKFLVCYREAALVYESFFEKMINYKLYIGSKMRNIVDIFFLALLFHNYVFPFYLFYSCRGIICMHFVLYTWQIGNCLYVINTQFNRMSSIAHSWKNWIIPSRPIFRSVQFYTNNVSYRIVFISYIISILQVRLLNIFYYLLRNINIIIYIFCKNLSIIYCAKF